jgi:flagellar basal body-associated protein FliL
MKIPKKIREKVIPACNDAFAGERLMDEKKKDQESAPKQDTKEKTDAGGSGNKSLFLGVIAGIVILNTVIAFFLVQMTRPKNTGELEAKLKADSAKVAAESTTEMGATTAEAPIEAVVNIAGTDGERFLKASIAFEFNETQFPGLGVELEKRAPKFKDILIDYLSKLTLLEVTAPDAKEKIRKDLLRIVNNSLSPKLGEVKEVYITQYIIQ